MPIVIYSVLRFLLFGVPFFVFLYLGLGIFASAIFAALISFSLSYLWLGKYRVQIVEWIKSKNKGTNERISEVNAAEDANIEKESSRIENGLHTTNEED
ncbi:MAG: DUF4229 domain-containing protein [Micrococcaceae bacterium]